MPYPPHTPGRAHALHAPVWHPDCSVSLVSPDGRPHLWCADCRCLVSLEAVAAKVNPEHTHKPPSSEAPPL